MPWSLTYFNVGFSSFALHLRVVLPLFVLVLSFFTEEVVPHVDVDSMCPYGRR